MTKMTKFISVHSDYDCRIAERIIQGRITPKRYKLLRKIIRTWNHNHNAPYGYSQNGYAYNCGCEHDCCGCLIGERMSLIFTSVTPTIKKVVIQHSASFNY